MIWLKAIPFVNRYYNDGTHLFAGSRYLLESGDLVVESLKPYSDLLGLGGESEKKTTEEMTMEERLTLVLDTLDKIQPNLDKIGEKLTLAQQEIDKINPKHYPQKLFGKNIQKIFKK